MTRIYTKKKVYPLKICLSCGEQYQARGSCCGKPRCKKWVYQHPGEIRGPLSVGGFIPKFLKPILGDENLVKLWNKGNENRVAMKKKQESDARLY